MAFPIAAVASLALGGIQTIASHNALKRLNKQPLANYDITPEQQRSYDRAESMARNGYTQEEENAYMQNLSRSNNANYRKAMAYGGNSLAGAIGAGLNYSNLGALNSFASSDAQLKRQNIRYADQMGAAISTQRNRNTALQIQRRDAQERALGQAMQAGISNMVGSLNLSQALGMGSVGKKAPQTGGLGTPSVGSNKWATLGKMFNTMPSFNKGGEIINDPTYINTEQTG